MTLTAEPTPILDSAQQQYRASREAHWDAVARKFEKWHGVGGYYQRRLAEIYQFLIPPGQRVLEIGCGRGDLLAAVKPSVGVGVDFSSEMITRAQQRHPQENLRFIQADAHELGLDETFDVIILSDLVNDLWDVQTVIEQLRKVSAPRTRVILNLYSKLWEWPLKVAQRAKLARPTLPQNWLTVADLANLLNLAGFEVMQSWEEVLWPVRTPIIDAICNRFLVKLWPFHSFALANFVIARPSSPSPGTSVAAEIAGWKGRGEGDLERREPTVSVIVPARNESGNIEQIFARTPQLGGGTELIFVEGHSSDDTYATIERALAAHPERSAKLFRQTGKGKGDAVRLGFSQASGDILMILDADLTVPPETLPRFYEAIAQNKGEFINGVRLVYPMEKQAMRLLNLAGNKFFGAAFSWLLGQSIKDTLCGTKVLWKRDYERIAAGRNYFGDFDPFGDFDLLFGAAKLNLKIVDLPIRYRERTYGTTNIQRFSHGWMLMRMVAFAAGRIKFI
jgi:ubiquinone/menaquinone biosynthesis C-methylase UbiE